ncbi:hypothetical protein OT109_08400 [Phycisphaeraceae bacterium D3-23]
MSFAAQPIAHPRAHRRPAGLLVARLEEGDARLVVDRLGVHRLDDAQLLGARPGVGQQLTDVEALVRVVVVAVELEDRRRDGERGLARGHAGDALALVDLGEGAQVLAAVFLQAGFVVEEVELRGRTHLVEEDDALGLGREVGRAQHAAARDADARHLAGRGGVGEERRERADPHAGDHALRGLAEELASCEVQQVFFNGVHSAFPSSKPRARSAGSR